MPKGIYQVQQNKKHSLQSESAENEVDSRFITVRLLLPDGFCG